MKLFALLIAVSCLNPVNVSRFFGNDHAIALEQMHKHSKQISAITQEYGVDDDLVKSIVFPEYIRNSVFSGMLEEQSLAFTYVELGSDVLDFSIGQFQIKPSFVLKLEEAVKENKYLQLKYAGLCIDQKNARPDDPFGREKTKRQIRFDRLKDMNWQTRYVCCFIDHCVTKYDLKKLSKIEQLKFLSTAYNVGIKETAGQIEANYESRSFPYGKKFMIDQLAYWEVSVDYYLKYCNSRKFEN